MSEYKELNEAMVAVFVDEFRERKNQVERDIAPPTVSPSPASPVDERFQIGICQWAIGGGGRFVPTAKTRQTRSPGAPLRRDHRHAAPDEGADLQ